MQMNGSMELFKMLTDGSTMSELSDSLTMQEIGLKVQSKTQVNGSRISVKTSKNISTLLMTGSIKQVRISKNGLKIVESLISSIIQVN